MFRGLHLKAFALLLALAACDRDVEFPDVQPLPDAGCALACGAACCATGETCFQGACCRPACEELQCGSDGCGGTCECPPGWRCGGEGACVCEESDEELCERLGRDCGPLTATDRCGQTRSVESCGSCADPKTCSDEGQCTCVPESDAELCDAQQAECGTVVARDRCGDQRTVTECGPCPASEQCDPQQKCVLCVPESDEAFCQRLGKNCGKVEFPDNCGVPRTMASCGLCPDGQTCGPNNICTGPTPANDTCSAPERLNFDAAGVATTAGDTTGASPSEVAGCGGGGADVVYVFTTDEPGDVEIVATPKTAAMPLLSVHADCGTKSSLVPDGCRFSAQDGQAARLTLPGLPAGTWYLWVATRSIELAFDLTVRRLPAADPPENDLCQNALALDLGEEGRVTYQGDTSWARHHDSPDCGVAEGPDVVFQLNFDEPATVVVKVTGHGFWPAVYWRGLCAGASTEQERACQVGSEYGAALIADLPAGVSYLVVDGAAGGRGPFTLDVHRLEPVPNDTCASVQEVAFDDMGTLTIQGDLSLAVRDVWGACAEDPMRAMGDAVYAFTLTEASGLTAEMIGAAGMSTGLHLRSACGDRATEVLCSYSPAGANARIETGRLAAGTYYLWVEGGLASTTSEGTFTVVATLSAPQVVPGDICSMALPITFDAMGKADLKGDTATANPDLRHSGPCAGGDYYYDDVPLATGPDLVYTFTLTEPASITATVTADPPDTPTLEPTLYLKSDCLSLYGFDEISCSPPYYDWTGEVELIKAKVFAPVLAPGVYFLVVDGGDGTSGPFSLAVQRGAPVLNDNCASPEVLSFARENTAVVRVEGGAGDDTMGTCFASGYNGADLVYAFVLDEPATITAVAEPDQGSEMRPSLYLRSSCDRQPSEIACNFQALSGNPVTLVRHGLPAGTWFLWVDGVVPGVPFTLTVTRAAAEPFVANDTCANAEVLHFGTSDTVTVQGTTARARNDYAGGCTTAAMPHNGNDVVYQLDLEEPRVIVATVEAVGTDLKPAVYVRGGNCAAATDERACLAATKPAVTAVLPKGTWYVIVDGTKNAAGEFKLTVKQTPVTAGDDCASAIPIQLDENGLATVNGSTLAPATAGAVGTCRTSSGNDVVYSLTLAEDSDVSVTVTPTSNYPYPYVYLRSHCTVPTSELACAYAESKVPVSIRATRLPRGTYYVWVDGHASFSNGPFTMDVQVNPAAPPPVNDTCRGAIAIPLDSTGQVVLQGDTSLAHNDYDAEFVKTSPAYGGGGDLVYSLDLTAATPITAVLKSLTGSGLRPVLHVRSDCFAAEPQNEVACRYSDKPGSVQIDTVLEAGLWYFIVDGVQSSAGPFELSLKTGELIPGDSCGNALPLTFDASGQATVTGDTSTATDSGSGWRLDSPVTAWKMPDLAYQFELSSESTVRIRVGPQRDSKYLPYFYLRSRCGDKASELGDAYTSKKNTPVEREFPILPAGTYTLWIDAYMNGAGAFEATVQVLPVPSPTADTCAGAKLLEVDRTTGKATEIGNTRYAHDDTRGTCAGAGAGDVVYKLVTDATHKVTVRATPHDPAYRPVVYLRSDCASAAEEHEHTCAIASGANAVAVVNALPAGEHFIVVDGVGLNVGSWDVPLEGVNGLFRLEVELEAPEAGPANETCFAAELLGIQTGSTSLAGTTLRGIDEATGSCSAAGAADVVYRIELVQPKRITAMVTPQTPGFWPALYLRRQCSDGSLANERACSAGSMGGGPVMIDVGYAEAGTWHLWVDGAHAQGTQGDFQLLVMLGSPIAPPYNDACSGVTTLVSGVPEEGTTVNAVDDYGSALSIPCRAAGASFLGPDVVYQYAPFHSREFLVTLTKTGDWDSALWVTEASCAGDGDACLASANAVPSLPGEQLRVIGKPGKVYFIVVDGVRREDAGAFTLRVDEVP